LGNYAKDEYDLVNTRTGHGVRANADQLQAVACGIERMPRVFSTEVLVKDLREHGIKMSPMAVDNRLKRLKAMVRLNNEVRKDDAWCREWVKVGRL
jgi:hypothetical protein